MKTLGFPISHKENEKRRAVVVDDFKYVNNLKCLYFEKGYFNDFGYHDQDIKTLGANVADRADILKCDVIVDPKIGDADYLNELKNQTVFGWVHAVQNKDITDKIIGGNLTAYAWEDMYEDGRHVFWRNNEIAGEAAIMHAFQCYGKMPYNIKVALIGRGNVASGALKILTLLGADVTVYNRNMEHLLRKELPEYDVIVNALLWDTTRKDHIIYKDDLNKLKKNSMIIDISCDRNGAIETSIPTTINAPTYYIEGILHYVVDHTPSLFYKTASESISKQMIKYIDLLSEDRENEVLSKAKCIEKGSILDKRINIFQNRG